MSVSSKLLVRTWIQGRGCVHLRSPNLTEREAGVLTSAVSDDPSMDADQPPELTLLELNPKELRGIALALRREIPDPDHPQRSAIEVRVLYLPNADRRLGESFLELFSSSYPEEINQAQTASLAPSKEGPASNEETQSDAAKRERRWRVRPEAVGLPIAALAVVALAIFVMLLLWKSKDSGEAGDPPQATSVLAKTEREWRETEEALQKMLSEDWAMQIRENKAVPSGGRELLEALTNLVTRPSLDGLVGKDREYLNDLINEDADSTSFSSFLHHLPEHKDIPQPPVSGADSPERLLKYLRQFAGVLRKKGWEGIDDDFRQNQRSQSIQSQLDYNAFYYEWSKGREPEANSKYMNKKERELAYRWVSHVRKIIASRYTSMSIHE